MRASEGEAILCHVSNIAGSLPPQDHIPIILNAGLPFGAGPFEAAPEEAFPALALDAVELAPAALSAADALDFSDILLKTRGLDSRGMKLPKSSLKINQIRADGRSGPSRPPRPNLTSPLPTASDFAFLIPVVTPHTCVSMSTAMLYSAHSASPMLSLVLLLNSFACLIAVPVSLPSQSSFVFRRQRLGGSRNARSMRSSHDFFPYSGTMLPAKVSGVNKIVTGFVSICCSTNSSCISFMGLSTGSNVRWRFFWMTISTDSSQAPSGVACRNSSVHAKWSKIRFAVGQLMAFCTLPQSISALVCLRPERSLIFA